MRPGRAAAALPVLIFSGADPGAPGCRQGILLKLGVLGAGADAGQADEVALPGGKIGNGEGGGGDCGPHHTPINRAAGRPGVARRGLVETVYGKGTFVLAADRRPGP